MSQTAPAQAPLLVDRMISAADSRGARIAAPPAGRRRILIATINSLIGNTGVHAHTRALYEGLHAAGHPAVIRTAFDGGPHWLGVFAARKLFGRLNPTWSILWHRRWHAAALMQAMGRHLRAHPADALLAQCPVSAGAALAVRKRLGLKFPIAMACHFNFSEATEYRDRGELNDLRQFDEMLAFEERVLRRVDRVIYVSGWARRVVEHDRGIRVRASSVIWNGIAEDAGPAGSLRDELSLSADDVILINVGTLERRKNQLGLVDLFAAVAPSLRRAHLVLVGDGPDRSAIRQHIERGGLAGRVHLLGTRRDVPALLKCADVYVHYAAMENCPVSLVEAARAALPIVAVPGGGTGELLTALHGAPLVSGDVDAAVRTLAPLVASNLLRRAAGEASRLAFESAFTQRAMVDHYLAALFAQGEALS